MNIISISRIAVPALAVVAASVAALVFGMPHLWRAPPVEVTVATPAPAISPPAPVARDEGSAVVAMAQAEANRMAAALPASPRSPDTDESVPVFDVARIDRTGDAVIAGRAAPGAIVELLLKGKVHDQAVADRSGQFVMIPPRLPPGDYELTLRSHLPDGRQATSKQNVVVALDEPESSPGGLQSHAETSVGTPETVGTIRPTMDQATGSSQAQQPRPSALQMAKRQDIDVSRTQQATTGNPRSDEGPSSAAVESRNATRVVSRGDSLWRISRVTYGVGTQYAIVYRANRNRIRNPDRIYPGQIIVLPMKAR
jgi:hypothetical protein